MPDGFITLPLTENGPIVEGAVYSTVPVPPGITVRELPMAEGLRRLQDRMGIRVSTPQNGDAEREERVKREADVVEAARRSQAEIRRHVDSYLKEHFETIAADIANVVIQQMHERIVKGMAGLQEAQAIALDRIGSDMRTQFRKFTREAWGPTKPKAKKGKRRV